MRTTVCPQLHTLEQLSAYEYPTLTSPLGPPSSDDPLSVGGPWSSKQRVGMGSVEMTM